MNISGDSSSIFNWDRILWAGICRYIEGFLDVMVPCLVFDACKRLKMWSRHGIEISAIMKEVYF